MACTFRFPWKVKGRGSHRRPGTGTAAWLQWIKRRCPPAVFPYLVASLSEFTQLLVDFQVDRVSDVSGHLPEEQGLYDLIYSESSFRAISWSFRTEGLFDPRPGWRRVQ